MNCENHPARGGVILYLFFLFFHGLEFAEEGAEQTVVAGAAGIDEHGQYIPDVKALALQDLGRDLFVVGIRGMVKLKELLLRRCEACF